MKPSRTHLLLSAVLLLMIALVFFVRHQQRDAPASRHAAAPPTLQKALTPARRQRPRLAPPREADRLLKSEGARTDVSLSAFPIKEYQHLPAPSGKPAGAPVGEAYIHVPSAGRRVAMEPNQLGEFPVMETQLKETVGVRLQLAEIKPGTPVRVAIIDGGSFPTKNGLSQVIPAADWRGVAFEFTTSHNIGFHRILVEAQGHPARILNFSAHDATWPPLSQTPAN